MEKINIAEILKDCPKGMELDCLMFDNVVFEGVDQDECYPIKVKIKEHPITLSLTKYGCWNLYNSAKCIIFPKGKTTWEGFQRPFKDGDIVTWKYRGLLVAFIYKERKDVALVKHHFALYTGSLGVVTDGEISLVENEIVFATEEEKQKLFDAIKANGYKWNAETKTLEILIKPKFKVGDEIVKRDSIVNSWIVSSVNSEYYGLKLPNGDECIGVMSIAEQDEYELVPNKFDVINFEPFMKVLVRSDNSDVWECDFFSSYNPECSNRFHCVGAWYDICIPYIGNEHLRGTTNDCDEYYKTWE